MKLTELHPKWISLGGHVPGTPELRQIGMLFDCPLHGEKCEKYPRIPVYFANPPSGDAMLPQRNADDHRWQLSGTGFDNMTLRPSIVYPHPKFGPQHWHGFVTNGEIH